MKKRIITLAFVGIMALSATITSFAGQWKQDSTGWLYQNDDSSFFKGGWNWVDGKCYYFTSEGYCLMNTTTPDGFLVDASGAWIIDGVVQTQTPPAQTNTAPAQQNEVQIDTLVFTPPAGFILDSSEGNNFYYENQNETTLITISSEVMDLSEQDMAIGAAMQEKILDITFETTFGTPQSKEVKQYTSGTWYRYQYAAGTLTDFPGAMVACARIQDKRIQMVSVVGDLSGADIDGIMNHNLR